MAEKGNETHVEDFVSGIPVRITPEEIHAVQVFSRILVEDYGYTQSSKIGRMSKKVTF
jgi:type I restriction enzyme M protein